ncbi:hypothetical protein AB6N23_05130 [Cellulomonas sp. 179-A 9B4 NHS]|uniref:hypothetical protein n=1 Tax=Cellulomonas sp. 179-A 9B4 NHS TaxID=3142379 RepID=UPI00399F7CF1
MSQPHPAAGDAPEPTSFPATPFPATDDELAARITHALHARAAAQRPDLDAVAARLRAEAGRRDAQPATVRALHRGGKIVAAGLVTGTLAVAGAGAAAAANPYSSVARAVEGAAQAVGIDWSAMPDGYTREQYEAFWDTYDVREASALSVLWGTDMIETKARAGQMLLDGQAPPVEEAFAASPEDAAMRAADEAFPAFWAAGYTTEDLEQLVELWQGDVFEVKTRAGQTLLDGGTLPIPPSGTPRTTDDAGAPPARP